MFYIWVCVCVNYGCFGKWVSMEGSVLLVWFYVCLWKFFLIFLLFVKYVGFLVIWWYNLVYFFWCVIIFWRMLCLCSFFLCLKDSYM